MKPVVTITLIIVGALLVVTPPIADYMHERNLVRLLEKPGVNNVNLGEERMGAAYRLGCWSTGAAMIVVSIGLSYNRGREPNIVAGQ